MSLSLVTPLPIQYQYRESLHKTWVETVLTDIGEKITDEDKSFVSSHSSHLGPVTSTPSARQPSSSNDSNHSLPNFDLNPDLSEPSVQARLSESSVQARINVCNVKPQTDDMPNETPKLKAKLQSLQDKFKDLNKQLSDYKELRTNFTQLSSAYSELCERNSMLEAELRSLKERHSQSENFIHPKVTNRVHKSPSASHTGISTHNSFSVLKDHLPADTVPSAPSVSLIDARKAKAHLPICPQCITDDARKARTCLPICPQCITDDTRSLPQSLHLLDHPLAKLQINPTTPCQAPKLTTSQIYRNHKFLYLATLYANELMRANFIREGQSKSLLNLELLWLKSKDLWNNATTTDPSM